MKSPILSLLLLLAFHDVFGAQGLSKSFSDPQKPSYLSIKVLSGNVIVVGASVNELFSVVGSWPSDVMGKPLEFELPQNGTNPRNGDGVSISESGNRMNIEFNPRISRETLYVRVPKSVNLKISVSGSGSAAVRGTGGEIEVECRQGKIFLDRISGPVVAHTLNKGLEAKFASLVPGKPNFLSSLNGNIELSLPKDSDVSFELDFFNGEVESSMPITLLPLSKRGGSKGERTFEAPSVAETSRKATHFRIKTHNGNIRIKDYE